MTAAKKDDDDFAPDDLEEGDQALPVHLGMDQVQERDNSFDGSESPQQRVSGFSSINERASPPKGSLKQHSSFGQHMNQRGLRSPNDAIVPMFNVSYVDSDDDAADPNIANPRETKSPKKAVRFQ